jgi:hypothetical protein
MSTHTVIRQKSLLDSVRIPAPVMGVWRACSSLKENFSFVHPEQDDPFDRKNRDLLEE